MESEIIRDVKSCCQVYDTLNTRLVEDKIKEYLKEDLLYKISLFSMAIRLKFDTVSISLEEILKIQEKFPSCELKMIANFDAKLDVLIVFP